MEHDKALISPGSLVTPLVPHEENYAFQAHPHDSPSNYDFFPLGGDDVCLVLEVRTNWIRVLAPGGAGWVICTRLFEVE